MTGVQTCALPICFPVTIDGVKLIKTWLDNSSEAYRIESTDEKPKYIRLEFEEDVSPEEVNEIQFLTNDPNLVVAANRLTKLGDAFIFERTDPNALGLKEPDNPKKATKVYAYKVKKIIQIAYNKGVSGTSAITMPDNQKIKLTAFPLKKHRR